MSEFDIKPGDNVYIIGTVKAIRRTRGGLWLCDVHGKEVSVPPSYLYSEGGKKYIFECNMAHELSKWSWIERLLGGKRVKDC